VPRLAADRDLQLGQPDDPVDDGDVLSLGLEYGPLLDMQFLISPDRKTLAGCITQLFCSS